MSWYVLHLRSNTEKKVAEICRLRDIDHYLPLRKETKIYQRRKVVVWKPLFRGYLFAQLNLETRVHLLQTSHLLHILDPGCEADLLLDLDQIRRALLADPRLEADVAFRAGRRVRIKGGPFTGIEGGLEAVRGKFKVRLNVDLIGQSVAVDVDRDLLEFIDGVES